MRSRTVNSRDSETYTGPLLPYRDTDAVLIVRLFRLDFDLVLKWIYEPDFSMIIHSADPGHCSRLINAFYAFLPSCSFYQTATHNRGCKFTREPVVKTSKLPDGNELQRGKLEGAACHQFLESCNSHLVQASGYLAESCCAVRLEPRPPAD